MLDSQCARDKMVMGLFSLAFNVLSTLGRHSGRTVEYSFAADNIGAATRKLLDVDSSGSIFPLKMARAGFKVTAVDMRPYCKIHPNLKFIRADLKRLPFPDNFFDAVTCISTIEHVGLSLPPLNGTRASYGRFLPFCRALSRSRSSRSLLGFTG